MVESRLLTCVKTCGYPFSYLEMNGLELCNQTRNFSDLCVTVCVFLKLSSGTLQDSFSDALSTCV